jgi:hypothetical protein
MLNGKIVQVVSKESGSNRRRCLVEREKLIGASRVSTIDLCPRECHLLSEMLCCVKNPFILYMNRRNMQPLSPDLMISMNATLCCGDKNEMSINFGVEK